MVSACAYCDVGSVVDDNAVCLGSDVARARSSRTIVPTSVATVEAVVSAVIAIVAVINVDAATPVAPVEFTIAGPIAFTAAVAAAEVTLVRASMRRRGHRVALLALGTTRVGHRLSSISIITASTSSGCCAMSSSMEMPRPAWAERSGPRPPSDSSAASTISSPSSYCLKA
jgi:hypothetical protein